MKTSQWALGILINMDTIIKYNQICRFIDMKNVS